MRPGRRRAVRTPRTARIALPRRGSPVALSEDDVRHVAMLARLDLSDEQVRALVPELSEILTWVDQIGEVATEDVPPTTHPFPLENVTRPDEPRPSLPREDVLAGAPETQDDRFAVPRIVAEES